MKRIKAFLLNEQGDGDEKETLIFVNYLQSMGLGNTREHGKINEN